MFCTNCGTKVGGVNFCPECGTQKSMGNMKDTINLHPSFDNESKESICEETTSTKEQKEIIILSEKSKLDKIISKYISLYIHKYGGSMMKVEDYLSNYNILNRLRFSWILIPTLITFIIFGPIAVFVALICTLIYNFLTAKISFQEWHKKTSHSITANRMEEVFDYFHKGLSEFPEMLVSYDKDLSWIEIRYKNETEHRICFNFDKKLYHIDCVCTTKQIFKFAVIGRTTILAKNSVKINPIIHAHMEYLSSLFENNLE